MRPAHELLRARANVVALSPWRSSSHRHGSHNGASSACPSFTAR
jgi:hypothetical protein